MDVGWLAATLLLARAAGVVLLWIARPAAEANLPPLSSARAIVEAAIGLAAALWLGRQAPIALALTLAVVRVVLGYSYRTWGGIRVSSLWWARGLVAAAVLIACRPGGFPWFASR